MNERSSSSRGALRRRLPRLGLAGALLLAAVACGGSEDPSGTGAPRPTSGGAPVVGVSLLTQQHDFYKDLEAALVAGAEAAGVELVIQSAELDPGRQAAQIEDFLTMGVDAIVVCPCDSSGVVPSIRQANKAGVPVFTADIKADGGDVVSHVASDNLMGGRLAAQFLARQVHGEGVAKVVVLDHPEVSSVRDRVRGFQEEMKRMPWVDIVDVPSAGGVRDKAHAVTENMLSAHPDLAGIFAINDDSALGALRAIGDDSPVVVVGYDGTSEARDAILSGGPLKADVVQNPTLMGRRTMEAVQGHLEGGVVQSYVLIPVDLIDAEALAGGSDEPSDEAGADEAGEG